MLYTEFADGIAFYRNEAKTLESEIAFYSKFTDSIRYATTYLGISEISYEDNLFIIKTIEKYKNGKDYNMENLLAIIKKKNFSTETLTAEAEYVKKHGEWTINCLMGYTSDMLEEAAKRIV